MPSKGLFGFTLVELLVALLILGQIATFTIPKIINAQQNSSYKAKAKEAAAMVSAAYQTYQLTTGASGSTEIAHLTPYMNYVSVDTASLIDQFNGGSTATCTIANCLRLHNGSILMYQAGDSFGGTSTTNATWFKLDPDGRQTDGTTNGPGKSVEFWLYYNGRLTTRANLTAGTAYVYGGVSAIATSDPSWFSWN